MFLVLFKAVQENQSKSSLVLYAANVGLYANFKSIYKLVGLMSPWMNIQAFWICTGASLTCPMHLCHKVQAKHAVPVVVVSAVPVTPDAALTCAVHWALMQSRYAQGSSGGCVGRGGGGVAVGHCAGKGGRVHHQQLLLFFHLS